METYVHLLEHDAFGVRRASEGVSLPARAQMRLLVLLVGPSLLAAMVRVFASRAKSPRFSCKTNAR